MDMLLSHRLSSAGLLQLTALCLASLTALSMAATDFVSTTAKPPTRADAFRQLPLLPGSGMFTFNQPGRSFVEYRHVWPSVKSAVRVVVQLRFRTAQSSGILAVLSSVSEGPRKTSNASGAGPVPTTLIRLHRGSLHVSVSRSRDQKHVTPAQSGIVIGQGSSCHCCF